MGGMTSLRQVSMDGGSFYNVNSEVGRLEAVLLHRPGEELERLTPPVPGRTAF